PAPCRRARGTVKDLEMRVLSSCVVATSTFLASCGTAPAPERSVSSGPGCCWSPRSRLIGAPSRRIGRCWRRRFKQGALDRDPAQVRQVNARPALDLAPMLLDLTLSLPYSRTREAEADRVGVELAACAGYDPRAA